MLFNKPINDLTFQDVVDFCKKEIPEGKQLDYKYLLPKNKEKFAKTIASFANALGGTIIIGVQDDKNDKPAPPFTGIAYHEKIRNSIEDIIQVYIDPIVFVDINTCVGPNNRMFVVINIPQSNLTPHLVGKSKRAYIRTGQSSRPEMIVHPSKLPWLLDHRKKSERLRHILYDKAESHFDNYLKMKNIRQDGLPVWTLSVSPLYPEEQLTDYKLLPQLIKECTTQAWFGSLPGEGYPLQPVQDGATVISNVQDIHKTTEFNVYGLLMDKRIAGETKTFNGHKARVVSVEKLAQELVLFFVTAIKYLNKISFGGSLYFRLKMSNSHALRVSLGKQKATVLEDYLRMDRTFNLAELEDGLSAIIQSILQEAAWGLGIPADGEILKTLVDGFLGDIE